MNPIASALVAHSFFFCISTTISIQILFACFPPLALSSLEMDFYSNK